MRRKTNIEIEFPLQVDAVLAGVAMVASALTVFLILTLPIVIVHSSMGELITSIGCVAPVPDLLPFAWPFRLIAFAALSLRWYLALKRVLARLLAAF